MRPAKRLLNIALAFAVGVSAQARINVDTVPGRDSVQLTIYNSVDLTMVRETRYLTLRKGMNHLEFSWANTLIDPTSVEFKAMTHADEVEVLDVSFPPRVTNTLEWRVNSEFSGEVKVEIQYFTSGITWSADYVAEASRNEKLARLAGFVKVRNDSGEDYENAQVRLIVGVIKLVEDISVLAGRVPPSATTLALADDASKLQNRIVTRKAMAGVVVEQLDGKKREIIKEGVSEYFLYTVEGRDTIPNGWSKRMSSLQADEVPLTSYYKFEAEEYGSRVMRYYKFKNSIESKLGNEPLPDGNVLALRSVSADSLLAFVGRTHVKYIPVNESVELDLGPDQEMRVKPVLRDWKKDDIHFDKDGHVSGSTITEEWEVELQNSKDINATLDIRRNFSGDWTVASADPYEKVDAHKIKFLVPLKPHEKRVLHYQLVVRTGVNAAR